MVSNVVSSAVCLMRTLPEPAWTFSSKVMTRSSFKPTPVASSAGVVPVSTGGTPTAVKFHVLLSEMPPLRCSSDYE